MVFCAGKHAKQLVELMVTGCTRNYTECAEGTFVGTGRAYRAR